MSRFHLTFILLFATTAALAEPAAPAPPQFVVGVWYQPIGSFAKWKARGINTLFGVELEGGNATREQWTAAARAAGLFYVIRPTTDEAQRKADAADPYLLAWEQQDEPDGAGNLPPDEMVARYKEFKTFGDKPVFINFDGWKMQWRPAADYQTYVQGGDWVGVDYYVINRGEGPAAIPKIADRLDKLKDWGDGKKKLFAFIECSDQNLKVQEWTQNPDQSGTPPAPRMRCPTADEVKAQVKTAVDHGATGIVYFPEIIGRNFESFDGIPTPLIDVITTINAQLTGGGPAPQPGAPGIPPPPTPRLRTDINPASPPAGKLPDELIINGRKYRAVE